MTQILNNMKRKEKKRKEKKRKEKKGLFYLIGIAIMVAIMGISCSAKATAPADFSETEDFVEAPAPEVKPSVPEQTPQKPVEIIGGRGAGQFENKIFENSDLTAKVKNIGNEPVIELSNGKEYGCGIPVGEQGIVPQISYRLSLRNEKYSEDGKATFATKDGYLYLYLSIGGKNHELVELVK